MQHGKIKSILLMALATLLFSFSTNWGGDSFQIYINQKLVLKEYVHNAQGVKSFQMDKASYNDQVDVYYSHCGQVGKDRKIAIKDGHNKTLKEFHFADFTGKNSGMSFKVSDVVSWDKRNGIEQLNIVYSAKELSPGRTLASIMLTSDAKARP